MKRSSRPALGWAAVASVGIAAPISSACESVNEVALRVVLPEDQSDLVDVDNLTLALEPGGELTQEAINGLDFSVQLELPKDTLVRANLFLARGSELRAWGRSSWFFDKSSPGAAIFVGRPGALSTFPGLLDDPDPALLAAYLPGRGVLMLETSGDTFLLGEYDLRVSAAGTLQDAPEPSLGGLYSLEDAVLRLAWGDTPRASRLDAESGSWTELLVDLPGPDELGALNAVASNLSASEAQLFVYGESQVWHIDLAQANAADQPAVSAVAGVGHDGPRPGASALGVERASGPPTYLVFGSDDDRPVFWSQDTGAFGPPGPWTFGRCVQINEDDAPARLLCGGGIVAGEASGALIEVSADRSGQLQATTLGQTLQSPLPDPLWLSDETALYAQGEGQLLRIARDSLLPDNDVSSAQRFSSGHSVALPTGATFLVGGLGNEGQPLDRWQVFTPDLLSIEP